MEIVNCAPVCEAKNFNFGPSFVTRYELTVAKIVMIGRNINGKNSIAKIPKTGLAFSSILKSRMNNIVEIIRNFRKTINLLNARPSTTCLFLRCSSRYCADLATSSILFFLFLPSRKSRTNWFQRKRRPTNKGCNTLIKDTAKIMINVSWVDK